jgi:hypothetical protein
MPQPSTKLHQPGEAQMYNEAAKDSPGASRQHAKDKTSKKRRDTFPKRFTKMDGTIKCGHRKDDALSGITDKADDKQTAKEELDAQEVEAIGDLIEKLPGPGGMNINIDKGKVLYLGIDGQKIRLGGCQRYQGQ